MILICTTFRIGCTPHLAHRKRQRPGRRPDDNPTLPYATVRSARLHRHRCRRRAQAHSRHRNITKYQRNSHPAMVAVIFNTGCLRGEVDAAEAAPPDNTFVGRVAWRVRRPRGGKGGKRGKGKGKRKTKDYSKGYEYHGAAFVL